MRPDEYALHDATGLAELVARREVTARELLDAALARLALVNPRLNVIAVPMVGIGQARAAETPSGPFAGVPFLLKDLGQGYEGQPDTAGCVARRNWISSAHSTYTQRCLDAGLVIFGRTTTPELGLKATTETALHGVTRNPWDLARSPGGSSGGAAAAVASGVVPMAGANDGGGSIRIPAAYCGLFGFKPGRGRVPEGPDRAEGWEGANADLVLSRSVRDAARMLDVLAGGDTGAPYLMSRPERPFAEALGTPPARLRIAVSTASPIGAPVHPEAVNAVTRATRLLEDLGHAVEPAAPPIDGDAVARAYLNLYLGQVAADIADIRARTGARGREFDVETRFLGLLGSALPAGAYVRSHRCWNGFGRQLGTFFGTYDLWLTPTTAGPPPLIGEFDMSANGRRLLRLLRKLPVGHAVLRSGALGVLARKSLARTPFTQLSNLTGTPSMSVPVHWAAPEPGGRVVPFGAQFVGPVGAEARLIGLAARMEAASPWAGRRPPERA